MILPPEIRLWTDRIYALDKLKFARLIIWVQAARRTYTTEVISDALRQFHPYACRIDDWWGYLDKILDKVEGKNNARQSETQHYQTVQAEKDFARTIKAKS